MVLEVLLLVTLFAGSGSRGTVGAPGSPSAPFERMHWALCARSLAVGLALIVIDHGSHSGPLSLQRGRVACGGSSTWWCGHPHTVCHVACLHSEAGPADGACRSRRQLKGVARDGNDPCRVYVEGVQAIPHDDRRESTCRPCSTTSSCSSWPSPCWGLTFKEGQRSDGRHLSGGPRRSS